MHSKVFARLAFAVQLLFVAPAFALQDGDNEWTPLFNGRDLEGWTPKIRGHDLGENFANTFRVGEGLLSVRYDKYGGEFGQQFGHLFWREKLSSYRLRVEYRFVGEQLADGPGWAFRNSGVMLHCEDPATMARDQEFPVSIEVQLLGGDGTNNRTNANVCTPGTHIEMNGELITRHCIESTSDTFHGDQWVAVEIEVRKDEVIRHSINGNVVLEYGKPQLDRNDPHARDLMVGDAVRLREGFLALQSESHPIDFRRVEILRLGE